MREAVVLDGRRGEGGGQILRSALALSVATGRPFRLEHVRARRRQPGLLRQHLTAVHAAAAVGRAQVEGAVLGSRTLAFTPTDLCTGEHVFDVGSAGSTSLVIQAALPPLLAASAPSTLVVTGGTHAKAQPPFEFLDRVWLGALRRVGAVAAARLVRPGFFPAGGGRIEVAVGPSAGWRELDLVAAGAPVAVQARAYVSALPRAIAERELAVVGRRLGWPSSALDLVEVEQPQGPGNAVVLLQEHEHAADVAGALGAPGVPAERVAAEAVGQARSWQRAGLPVGPWLADQLMVPLALGAGGRYRTGILSSHARTNRETVQAFLGDVIEVHTIAPGVVDVVVRGRR